MKQKKTQNKKQAWMQCKWNKIKIIYLLHLLARCSLGFFRSVKLQSNERKAMLWKIEF